MSQSREGTPFSRSPLPRSDSHFGDAMPGLGWVDRGGVPRYVALACQPLPRGQPPSWVAASVANLWRECPNTPVRGRQVSPAEFPQAAASHNDGTDIAQNAFSATCLWKSLLKQFVNKSSFFVNLSVVATCILCGLILAN